MRSGNDAEVPTRRGDDSARLTRSELARSASVDEAFVDELTSRSILSPDGSGHGQSDLYVVRFAKLLLQTGISLDDLAGSIQAGVVHFGNLEASFPDPVRATGRTHAELAAELGLDPPLLGRIRLAAGLAAQEPEDLVQSDEEPILRLIVELAGALGDTRVATRIARIVGEPTQRIASSALGIYDEMVTQPWIESGVLLDEAESRRSSETGRRLLDRAEELLLALYRRHIESGLVSDWATATESLMARHGVVAARPRKPPGIAFVDLSGFTRLTEEEGDEVAVGLADRLVATAEATAEAHEARIVKLLGDGVMLYGDDPTQLVKAAVALVHVLPDEGLPPAHAGVHAGPLIERDGDFFGRTVNVAARIADKASPGEVLISESVLAGAPSDMRLTELPTPELRGVQEPVRVFRVEPLR